MKWLILLAALVAALFAVQILIADMRRGHKRSTMVQLAAAVFGLALLGLAIYTAHLLGLYSVPIVALAFVPFGLALRWSILATREMRRRREEAGQPVSSSRRGRLVNLAIWPLFLVLVALVAVVGLMAGILAAQR
ncbi:MAG: hypothetical protein ACXWN4_04970 [Candidatus Limnocylindrales bacterium]